MSDSENPEPARVAEMVESIREWLFKQPHLPHIEDREVLKKFLVNCKFRLQQTKSKIENYYSARTGFPAVFQERDPCAPEMRLAARATPFFPLPRTTPKGRKVVICKLDCDPDEFIPSDYMKRMFMVFDVMFCEEASARLDYEVVVDFRGFSFRHFLKLTTVARTFMSLVENVMPATLKGAHYVHVPPFIDKVAEFFKMLVKPKLRERFLIHKDLEAFYKVIGDQDILPSDLGGKEASIDELCDAYQRKIESYKKWFEEEENIRSNEDLRPPSSTNSWLMGTEGSFKRLTVD